MRRGLAPDRERARLDVASGLVLVAGTVADKPGRQVAPSDAIVIQGPPPRFVGRGGEKLDAALEAFDLDVNGCRAIDAGASTGGFTDCLLQRGAAQVVAIDVGYGQMHERVRRNPRVTVFDRTNVRTLDPETIGGPGQIVVADLSFISLRVVGESLLRLTEPAGDLVLLVKPQFEADRAEANKGKGIIGDHEVWRRVLHGVIAAFAAQGATMMGVMASPITGSDGNVEFLVHLHLDGPIRPASVPYDADGPAVDEAVRVALTLRHEVQ